LLIAGKPAMAHIIETAIDRVSVFIGKNIRIGKLLLDGKQTIEYFLLSVFWPSLDALQQLAERFG
jgi:hypothetical protein